MEQEEKKNFMGMDKDALAMYLGSKAGNLFDRFAAAPQQAGNAAFGWLTGHKPEYKAGRSIFQDMLEMKANKEAQLAKDKQNEYLAALLAKK